MNKGENPKIVIIDSGISTEWKFWNCVKGSYFLENGTINVGIEKNAMDLIGHGTAIADVIYQNNPEIDIINFRLCDTEMDEEALIIVLSYIYSHLNVDIINISAGITYIYNYDKLYDICKKLSEKGVIIVSAFDNDGAISYPAAFNVVIGVDVTDAYSDKNDLIWVKESVVDIYVPNNYYRTIWKGKNTIISGTSFAAAKVTAVLTNKIKEYSTVRNKNFLIDRITNIKRVRQATEKIEVLTVEIKKAILFPINKESLALLRYRHLLNFEIVGVYDDKLSGNIGKNLFNNIVQSYEHIDWKGDFDTVILSCVSELSRLTKKNYCDEILRKSKKEGKYIYSFRLSVRSRLRLSFWISFLFNCSTLGKHFYYE